jgi:hypothetical protein
VAIECWVVNDQWNDMVNLTNFQGVYLNPTIYLDYTCVFTLYMYVIPQS